MGKTENLQAYKNRIHDALDNDFLRSAMDKFAIAYRTGRANAFSEMDVKQAIQKVAQIKADALKNIDKLLEQFKAKAEQSGAHVHLAKTAREANSIIARIAKDNSCKKIIKSKSMTAEEICLNPFLEQQGLAVTETDLGEWIVQLRKEGPSHMVMPAIHLSRFQVADLFSDVTGTKQSSEIEFLVKVARKELREKFIEADMGITGANYAIAKTGTLGILTNEGNARLVTTMPKIHVALVGIEKLLPAVKDALLINEVLPKNATGQNITAYVTWITGPSECTTAPEQKRQMHIVFLDNGRSNLAGDPVFSQALHCVRCGACANVCPVYRMVGGHQMGYIYIGAIGLITTYFFHGRENAKNLVQNCINCGACKDVCAANIDLPRLIKEVYSKIIDEDGHPVKSLMLGKVLKSRKLFHALLRTASIAQKPVTGGTQYLRHLPMIFSKDHNFRILPAIAKKPFRDRWENIRPVVKDPAFRIGLFSGCAQDFVYPQHLEAGLRAMAKANIEVEFPMEQTCCGLPALMMGEKSAATDVGMINIDAFKDLELNYIVTLCASCASHLKKNIPLLLEKTSAAHARTFADKVISFSEFMNKVVGLKNIPKAKNKKNIAWHSPCHLCRGLGITKEPIDIIKATGHNYIKTQEEETCCGFGGSFSVNFPSISKEILEKKLDDVVQSGAELLVTECPGCVMQLKGGALKQNRKINVMHLSELISE